ncbi:MAG: HypC/HybG/HupF family hydrogenase formation chaperone [Gaiellaceae bacterium]
MSVGSTELTGAEVPALPAPERGTSGRCDDGHCVTCSDEGVPMRVVQAALDGVACCADEDGQRVDVLTELVGPVARGDEVLVHAGVAIARLA